MHRDRGASERQMRDRPVSDREGATRCPGCGARVADSDGPTHPYLGAAPGCWALYGEVLAREYGELRYPEIHRLTVDAYAAQHPGVPSRRSIQSLAVHLVSLHLVLDRGIDPVHATGAIRRLLARRPCLAWLDPPPRLGATTVADLLGAGTAAEHERRVRSWAIDVWAAWAPHHAAVRGWADLACEER